MNLPMASLSRITVSYPKESKVLSVDSDCNSFSCSYVHQPHMCRDSRCTRRMARLSYRINQEDGFRIVCECGAITFSTATPRHVLVKYATLLVQASESSGFLGILAGSFDAPT